MADTSSITPASMAQSLATAYTQAAQDQLTTQTKNAQTTSTALTKLQSALSAFNTALTALSSKSGVAQYSAGFSDSSVGTATAAAGAQPGSYSFFVEQVATANQVSFADLPAVPVSFGGPIAIQLADGSSININLVAADQDGDGTISQAEIARAINLADDNQGKVTAMVMNVGNTTQLVLSAGSTGAGSAITVDTSGLPAGALKDALSAPKQLVAAQDAVVWLGAQGTGTRIQQASNTVTAIPGVTMNFTHAQTTGSSPVTLTVASDSSGTASNVQSFVDAYNTLEKALDALTDYGDPANGVAAAAFASDSGVRSLRDRLATIVRQDFGGVRLMDFGVTADRNGQLSLDSTKLKTTLAAKPEALDQLFGKTGLTTSSGLLGTFSKYADTWINSTSGQIKTRQDSLQRQQKDLTAKQTTLDNRYNQAYQRYLKQFTALQNLQSQMSQTTSIFDNLASS